MMQIVECPRDAMQGWKHPIATADKIRYINSLLQVGFHTIDFGSFVSPKAIPQMADTSEVLAGLHVTSTSSKLLAIVANTKGAEDAVVFPEISYLGFPFSVSPTFQQRNTNSTQLESIERIKKIQDICLKNKKQLVVYLSMGFGNPYGDDYNEEILFKWADEMINLDVRILSLADTVGLATAQQISFALNALIPQYRNVTIGVHLHASASNWQHKLQAAIDAGCQRFDGALKGIGGCPMAQDDLVGNMDTVNILDLLQEQKKLSNIDFNALQKSLQIASEIFI